MAGLLDRAKVSTATVGTGTLTLGAATSPYRTWANAGALSNLTYSYLIEEGTAWELGWGVYSSTGPTLTRNLISSSTGALLNLAGTATVACVANEMDIGQLNPLPQVAGTYVTPDTLAFAAGSATFPAATTIVCVPFSRLAKVDAVAAEVTTASAGNTLRGAIYTRHPTTGMPHLLIEEGVSQSTGTIGIKAMTFAAARWIDRPIYVALACSTTVTLRTGTILNTGNGIFNSFNTTAPFTRVNVTVAAFGAMPADMTGLTMTLVSGTTLPALRLAT